MLTGTMVSELIDNRRIWTLTVSEYPRPGQLIEWSEPACGSIPARSGIRGWITGPGIITVATESTRWVVVNVK